MTETTAVPTSASNFGWLAVLPTETIMARIQGWINTFQAEVYGHQQESRGCNTYVEEIPANAVRSEGLSTTGFNLLLNTDFPALEERQVYEVILIPKRKF